jgi:hypothetical protein
MRFTDSKTASENIYTPTRTTSLFGAYGFSTSLTTLPFNNSAAPNIWARRSITNGAPDLWLRVAHHHADVADAGGGQRFDAIEQYRLVGHRHKLLGARVRQRTEARAATTAQDQSFHLVVCPPNAPSRFEKVPMPARVNEMLSR